MVRSVCKSSAWGQCLCVECTQGACTDLLEGKRKDMSTRPISLLDKYFYRVQKGVRKAVCGLPKVHKRIECLNSTFSTPISNRCINALVETWHMKNMS